MAEKIKIGIVVSEYNFDITMMMLERAKVEAEFLGAEISKIVYVPGTFDIPL
ncbi:MAG: 6,7-dimethyl-8-ribityllumazine synthase, partial [Thermoplasmata archaeon]